MLVRKFFLTLFYDLKKFFYTGGVTIIFRLKIVMPTIPVFVALFLLLYNLNANFESKDDQTE
jgi:hypothetical protein